MTFFSRDKKGGDLALADYKNIWTKFCFLDESGSLDNPTVPFFTVGFIKCSEPYYIASKIYYERNKVNFHDELKFNKLSAKNINFAKFVMDSFFSTRSLSFCSYTLDKNGKYFRSNYSGDPWKAYEDISVKVIDSAISQNEIIIVIADHVLTPKDIRFEVNVKRRINDEKKRLAVAGVCRIDSKSNDLLQLADLMVGSINYDLKTSLGLLEGAGDKHKLELVKHFKSNLGVKDFLNGHRNYFSNIFVDKDILERNEKGQSS